MRHRMGPSLLCATLCWALVLGGALARPNIADAATLRVLTIPGIQVAIDKLAADFERTSGHTLVLTYEILANVKPRIEAGDFDVAVYAKPQIEDLAKRDRVVAASVKDITRTMIGVAVKSGAPLPPLKTVDDFKRALIAAQSVTYTKESATGEYLTRLLARLDLADKVAAKLTLQSGGNLTVPAVAEGKAELAIVLVSDIKRNPGVALVGLLPDEIQNSVTQTAAVSTASPEKSAAVAFVEFLATPQAVRAFETTGLYPVGR